MKEILFFGGESAFWKRDRWVCGFPGSTFVSIGIKRWIKITG
ncbi:MAG TPA: hypothetical protein VFX48_06120 [Saprospiraceae bacterium]|nr:hypothetical protein [Saprospiraceae bacterium]